MASDPFGMILRLWAKESFYQPWRSLLLELPDYSLRCYRMRYTCDSRRQPTLAAIEMEEMGPAFVC